MSAWLYGCTFVNGALLGLGERTGNTPIEALIMEYISLVGDDNGIDTKAITEMKNYFEKEVGLHIPRNQPFVGSDFNATSAGVHIDGLAKNEEIYTAFDTKRILNRPITINITDKSGLAGIAHWINSHFALIGQDAIEKTHPGVARINKRILKQYEEGRVTAMSDEEMEHMVRRYMPGGLPVRIRHAEEERLRYGRPSDRALYRRGSIKSMAPERQEEVLKGLVAEYPYIQFAYVVNAEGVKVTRNITQAVDRAKYAKIDLHEDFSDRDWFIQAALDRQDIGDGPLLVKDNRRPMYHRFRTDT